MVSVCRDQEGGSTTKASVSVLMTQIRKEVIEETTKASISVLIEADKGRMRFWPTMAASVRFLEHGGMELF